MVDGLWTIRKSDELIAVMRRFLVALQVGDTETVRGLIGNDASTLMVGTGGAWLYGREAYEVVVAQTEVLPEYGRTFHSLEAYEFEKVGWGAARSTVSLPDGTTHEVRTTAVFRMESGAWQVVQWHASNPTSNAHDWADANVPTSLSDLVDTLPDDLDAMLSAQVDTRQVSLLISDIADSTRHGVELGDALWSDVVTRHFDRVRRITDAHRGTVIKTMGDGVLIVFDRPAEAASAALEILDSVIDHADVAEYQVRIGVHVGDAVHSDDDYFGYTVNKTARLTSAAGGNEILVSRQVASALEGHDQFRLGEARALKLKGLPGTHHASSLSRATGPLGVMASGPPTVGVPLLR